MSVRIPGGMYQREIPNNIPLLLLHDSNDINIWSLVALPGSATLKFIKY
ncbi:MAG: hypothetical protein ACFE8A_02510 [Candidatus Hodarchaeota archaeon]